MSQGDFLSGLLSMIEGGDEGGPTGGGRGSALSRLAALGVYSDPVAAAEAARPVSEHMFATLRVGFIDCDDEDATVALALIESLEVFTTFTYAKPGIKMAPVLGKCVTSYIDATNDVIQSLKEISLVRASALGREVPKIEDFMPEPEPSDDAGNSGVADRVEPDVPAFIHPQNERAV